ncbi:Hint domain-containing protein [uncultured Tateyamaria sp.]|uniref:Hint domain-containing protein n=1 Tax=uncultured Tateyamaria sp. TaxID=455651 RepID=UPI0026224A93|nr:Hint domain-containing protein [uncultured Tateyamaria sp.]
MALTPGDILFTAHISDPLASGGSDSFSFIATKDIPAGEVITIYDGAASVNFTVGAGGLSAFERVTIIESATTANTFSIPTGNGTLGAWTPAGGVSNFSTSGSSTLIATSGTTVLAAIVNSTDGSYATTLAGISTNTGGAITLDDTALQALAADMDPNTPNPLIDGLFPNTQDNDNVMFVGGNISGIDNPANWVAEEDDVDPSNPNISGTTYATQDATIFCFAAGTRIATPAGEVTVEALAIDDMIRTADGRGVAVKWVGVQTLRSASPGLGSEVVRIAAGALGPDMPNRDLVVTSDHGMIIDDMVINASALVNGSTIDWVSTAQVQGGFKVYHIETEGHEVILANGAPSETFIDCAGRAAFENYGEYIELYGYERLIPEMPRIRIAAQRMVPADIRERLGIPTYGDFLDGAFDTVPQGVDAA